MWRSSNWTRQDFIQHQFDSHPLSNWKTGVLCLSPYMHQSTATKSNLTKNIPPFTLRIRITIWIDRICCAAPSIWIFRQIQSYRKHFIFVSVFVDYMLFAEQKEGFAHCFRYYMQNQCWCCFFHLGKITQLTIVILWAAMEWPYRKWNET